MPSFADTERLPPCGGGDGPARASGQLHRKVDRGFA